MFFFLSPCLSWVSSLQIRYSSCRYNERQLTHATVVNVCVHGRNVGVIARGNAGGREPVGLFFAIDLVVHVLLNGTSLVTRDGAEDAHVRVPYPRALCKLYKPNLLLQPSLHRRRVSKVAYPVETHGLYHEVHNTYQVVSLPY